MSDDCPTTELLAAALRRSTPSSTDAPLAEHLADCAHCRARLEALAGGSDWVNSNLRRLAVPARPASKFVENVMQALEEGRHGDLPKPAAPVALDFLQPPDQPGIIGRFGSYEVLASVAVGGMGIVLKAHDPGLDRIVALKVLPPGLAGNALARARFLREARAAAAVVHEHVVPIYAVDECSGLPYLVMQFIAGRTLAERLRTTGPLRVEEALRIGAQTAAGLAAAHQQGLIHRDVKPGNILLENSVERVKITDFGLAHTCDDASLTEAGFAAGTPEYMSPEQAIGETLDQRSDLFSLGTVLYEMVTGVSPFRAEQPLESLRRVCDERPTAAHLLNEEVPLWMGHLIQQLMAQTPEDRPPSAALVAAELNHRLADWQRGAKTMPSVTVAPSHHPPRTPWLRPPSDSLTLGVLVLVVLILSFAWQPGRRHEGITASPPAAQPPPVYYLPATAGRPERGYATLSEAVAAAEAGAVVECRFQGVRAHPIVSLGQKPLILRAGQGWEPVLTTELPDVPLITTRAALALEGLTFRFHFSPGLREGVDGRMHRAGILVEQAPLLAVHCRFELEWQPDMQRGRRPKLIHLLNAGQVALQHCDVLSQAGMAIEWATFEPPTPNYVAHLSVNGCLVRGHFLSRGGHQRVPTRLTLSHNTFVNGICLSLAGYLPESLLEVDSAANLFVVSNLTWAYRMADSPLESWLRWRGGTNLYAAASYATAVPALPHYEDWVGSPATEEKASMAAPTGIRKRLDQGVDRPFAGDAAMWTPTPEERQQLIERGWSSSTFPGVDGRKVGCGPPYHQWRASADYGAWQSLVREHIRPNDTRP